MTADAVRRAETLAAQLHGITEDEPEHATLSAALRDVVNGWAEDLQTLGAEPKGSGSSTSTTASATTAGAIRSPASRITTATRMGSRAG